MGGRHGGEEVSCRNGQSGALCLSGLSWGASSLKSLPTAKDGKQGALSLCVPRELQCGGTQRQQQRRWRKRRAGQHLRVQHLPGHSQRRRHQPVRPPLLVSAPGPERTLLVEHSALARGGEGLPTRWALTYSGSNTGSLGSPASSGPIHPDPGLRTPISAVTTLPLRSTYCLPLAC